MSEFWHNPTEATDVFRAAVEGKNMHGEMLGRRRDGSSMTVEYTTSLIRSSSGVAVGLLGTFTDVSEHRRLEQQVRDAQRMESLGILAGGVAHDMNNILGAIMGITSLLRQDSDADSSLAKDYDTIVQACTRGRTMVRGLLDFTRQEPSNFLHIDLNAIVLEQCNLLTKTLPVGVRLDVLTSPDLLPMLGDINKLQRVVLNLCTNAVDAVGSNGRVGVETRNNDLGEVELVVHDDGPGMQPEVLGKAFEPFFTTKPVGKGKGLGLAIVYGTVRSHHGHIDIKTGQGLGTRVVVRFPAYQSATPKPAESTFSKIAVRSLSHTVLLVDGLLVARLRHFYTTALVRTRLPLPAHHSSLAKRTNRGRITLKP